MFLLNEWQEVINHPVQHVTVRLVGIFRPCRHADIRANVKADVGALMNERSDLLIEYSNQIASLTRISVFIVACKPKIEWLLIPAAAKEFISVLKLFSGCCEVDVCTLKQRNGERRQFVPFGLSHITLQR